MSEFFKCKFQIERGKSYDYLLIIQPLNKNHAEKVPKDIS